MLLPEQEVIVYKELSGIHGYSQLYSSCVCSILSLSFVVSFYCHLSFTYPCHVDKRERGIMSTWLKVMIQWGTSSFIHGIPEAIFARMSLFLWERRVLCLVLFVGLSLACACVCAAELSRTFSRSPQFAGRRPLIHDDKRHDRCLLR